MDDAAASLNESPLSFHTSWGLNTHWLAELHSKHIYHQETRFKPGL